jgi:hypothetical protein
VLRDESVSRSYGLSCAPPDLQPLPTGILEVFRSVTSRRQNRRDANLHGLSHSSRVPLPLMHLAVVTTRRSEPPIRLADERKGDDLEHLSLRDPIAPPSTWPVRVHSQRPRPPSGRWCQPSARVPSSWFLTTSTAYSVHIPAGLLHPAADHGVRCVSDRPRPSRSSEPGHSFSHRWVPFEEFPSYGSRTTSLRPAALLPSPPAARRSSASPRFRGLRIRATYKPATRLQGFTPPLESVATNRCCQRQPLVPSMGFTPFEANTLSVPSRLIPVR